MINSNIRLRFSWTLTCKNIIKYPVSLLVIKILKKHSFFVQVKVLCEKAKEILSKESNVQVKTNKKAS